MKFAIVQFNELCKSPAVDTYAIIISGSKIVGNEKVSLESAQELIRNGDVNNGSDDNGYTALHVAAIKGMVIQT